MQNKQVVIIIRVLLFYLSIALMPSSILEHLTRRWLRQKSLHLSLSKHSLADWFSLPPLVVPLSCMYSFTLFLHLPGSLPLLFGPTLSLTCTFFTNSSLSILSKYVQTTSMYFFSPIPPLHNLHHLHGFPYRTFCTCLSSSHLVTQHGLQVTHFHSTHSWKLSPFPVHISDRYIRTFFTSKEVYSNLAMVNALT